MAKGNLFLGMGRGKVGDVVFYRMNGRQMSRVRNRDPKNPRSNEQLYQRAVIATVMKAYSAGKEIYDHSFQGYTVGEGCMRRFNSVNARILREILATEINGGLAAASCKGRFVWPRATESVPVIGLQVSEGTLNNNLIVEASNTYADFKFADAKDGETAMQYFTRLGTAPGDIYTFVFHLVNVDQEVYRGPFTKGSYDAGYHSEFGYIRLIVKEPSQDITIKSASASEIFIIENSANVVNFNAGVQPIIGEENKGASIEFSYVSGTWFGVGACIRSRLDIDVRSTAYTKVVGDDQWGIVSPYVLPIWRDEVQKIGNSELILEGGELDGGALPTPRNLELMELQAEEGTLANYPVNDGKRKTARHRGTTNNKE